MIKFRDKLYTWMFYYELRGFEVVKVRGFGIFVVDVKDRPGTRRITVFFPWWKAFI